MAFSCGRCALAVVLVASACSDDSTNINGPGVLVTPPADLATSELGEQLAFQVVLTAEPSSEVRLPLRAIPAEEGAVEPAELVFTPGNWDQPQSFQVIGVDDEVDDGVRSFTVFLDPLASADLDYAGLDLGDYELRNYDDEIAVEQFDPADDTQPPSLLIFEGFIDMDGNPAPLGTSIGVRLTDPPRSGMEVVLGLELVNAEGDASFDPGSEAALTTSLTFDEDNYATTQIVDIASFDDNFQDTGAISLVSTLTTDDPVYAQLTLEAQEVVQVDDEVASITLSPKNLVICEGFSQVVNVAVSTVPEQDDVTVSLGSADLAEVRPSGPVTLGGNRLTGKITLDVPDDDIEQGDREVTLDSVVTTSDPVYELLDPGTVTVTIIDDDNRAMVPGGAEQPLLLQLCPAQ